MKKLLSFLVPAFVMAAIAATTISTTQSVIRNGFTTSNGVMQAGLSASAGGSNAIAIGVGTDASKSNSIAIGLNALSRGYGSLAVGAGSTAGLNASNSFAVGPGATVTAADSGVIGVANTAVSVPGTLSVGTTNGSGGTIGLTSSNGFVTTLQSSMQVTNVTWLEESNANNGLSWSTNVSGGAGGTVTNQRVRIPDGANGTILSMSAGTPTWIVGGNSTAGVTWFGTAPATNVLVNLSSGNVFRFQATNNFTLIFTNGMDGQDFSVTIYQDSTGNRTCPTLLSNNTGGSQTNRVIFGTDITGVTLTTNGLSWDNIKARFNSGIAGIPNTTNSIDILGFVRGYK